MAVVLVSFFYIFLVLRGIGALSSYLLKKMFGIERTSLIEQLFMSVMLISVFAEYFSIFGKVGALCHIIVLICAAGGFWLERKNIKEEITSIKKVIFSWEGLFYLGFALFIAFYTSRGTFHTDTNIYHASAIRMYEEYGLIKGMGNLQLHYAYNSAYIAFASVFSMNWLFGKSIHTTTGFLELMLAVYSMYSLKRYKSHMYHIADMMKVGILFYILVILNGSMSPATDYATMMLALLVMSLWCDQMENGRDVLKYALLSVFAVFVVTLKFSACMMVLIAIYPAVMLIKKKDIRNILRYLCFGIVILAPFLIRNYLISGWLLYPFDGIDIFDVAWKVPKEYLLVDEQQIKVWGRCLYDVKLIDMPIKEWVPVWLEHQDRYEMMLIYGIVVGGLFSLVYGVRNFLKKKPFALEYLILLMSIAACVILWFLTAPFIRYSLAFIFAVMLMPLGSWLSEQKKGFFAIGTGILAFATIACLSPYFDNYIKDMGVFIKQNIREPYYIVQKDYDTTKVGTVEINGNTIYYCDEGEINDYHHFPNTCYKFMLERTTLAGNDIKDGFRPD